MKTNFLDLTNQTRVLEFPIQRLPEFILGSHILLVTTDGFLRRGLVKKIIDLLHPKKVSVWSEVKPNPEVKEIERVIKYYKNYGIDCIVGVGGGSAIDTAKVLAVMLHEAMSIELLEALNTKIKISKKLPIIAIPTTAGTGSEVTPFATIWDKVSHKKYSLSGIALFPDFALLDPTLTTTLNFENTLFPALDTISHALESIWNKNKTITSVEYALNALSIILDCMPGLMKVNPSIDKRKKMLIASTLAGKAISLTQTAIAHSISYPITLKFNMPHGLASSITLEPLIEYYLDYCVCSNEKKLLLEIRSMLQGLKLPIYALNYANANQVKMLRKEMFTPDRINNYALPLPDICKLIDRSWVI